MINSAERLRMLSQKLTKEIFQFLNSSDSASPSTFKDILATTRQLLYKSYLAPQRESD
jgi:hypothetical protein